MISLYLFLIIIVVDQATKKHSFLIFLFFNMLGAYPPAWQQQNKKCLVLLSMMSAFANVFPFISRVIMLVVTTRIHEAFRILGGTLVGADGSSWDADFYPAYLSWASIATPIGVQLILTIRICASRIESLSTNAGSISTIAAVSICNAAFSWLWFVILRKAPTDPEYMSGQTIDMIHAAGILVRMELTYMGLLIILACVCVKKYTICGGGGGNAESEGHPHPQQRAVDIHRITQFLDEEDARRSASITAATA